MLLALWPALIDEGGSVPGISELDRSYRRQLIEQAQQEAQQARANGLLAMYATGLIDEAELIVLASAAFADT